MDNPLENKALPPLEPDWRIPFSPEEGRRLAIEHVRALLSRGYTEEQAKDDWWLGDGQLHGGPPSGCVIKHGKIQVPLHGPSRYVFCFRELAEEVRSQHKSLSNTVPGGQ